LTLNNEQPLEKNNSTKNAVKRATFFIFTSEIPCQGILPVFLEAIISVIITMVIPL
jgi:hypothetical protein